MEGTKHLAGLQVPGLNTGAVLSVTEGVDGLPPILYDPEDINGAVAPGRWVLIGSDPNTRTATYGRG